MEGAIDYYTQQMKTELEAEVSELNRQYSEIVSGMKDAAMRDIANKKRYISEDERKAATDTVNEAITSIKFGSPGALDVLMEQVPYMSDTRKLALLQEIGRITEASSDQQVVAKARRLYDKLDEVRSGELLPVKIAQALPSSADTPLRQLQMTHPTYKGHKNSIHSK
ncbi:hypothetical protein [Priestia flexa]|uniref:hypothetical protein n=1 Tax=Priestia flexa TaxID=86664 RepID=UPI001C94087B|nr:hypothetical protein [Priestia flexa]MBY6087011.1 hypothetical protein [Priestia flexa]